MNPFQAFTILVLLALNACGTPGKYYRLSADGPQSTGSSSVAIGVGPVILPDYIDRSELVFQSAENSFEIPTGHRWAGSLRDNVSLVIGTNIGRRLGTGNVYSHPWETVLPLTHQVRIQIRQFHSRSSADAVLNATWSIEDKRSGKLVRRKAGQFTEPLRGDGYEAVVAAESRLLSQLAEAIARDIPAR